MSLKTLLKTQRAINQAKLGKLKNRNLAALSPLLKKGGVHDKDNAKNRHKQARRQARLALKQRRFDE